MRIAVLLAVLNFVPQEKYGYDPSAIEWVRPSGFEEARERAKKLNRILIVKGIAFGVDEEGARAATRGKW